MTATLTDLRTRYGFQVSVAAVAPGARKLAYRQFSRFGLASPAGDRNCCRVLLSGDADDADLDVGCGPG